MPPVEPESLFEQTYDAAPDVIASAPGRIEVLGNHTDYNGGTVLGVAIDRRTHVALRSRTDSVIRLTTDWSDERVETATPEYRDADLPEWVRYPLGVLDEFRMQVAGASDRPGFDLLVHSDLPAGAGLSSSAALEMATALALNALWAANLDRLSLIRMAHRAENRFVGVPCGLLDQAVTGFDQDGGLVVVRAGDGAIESRDFPAGTRFVLATSHVSRQLTSSKYEERHRECRSALTALSGFVPKLGHLAHLHPLDVAVYGSALEPVVRKRAQHVVSEEFRVREFLDLLGSGDVEAAGRLLTSSHESSRTYFENSLLELDVLVAALLGLDGVLGARLTGAGWGGSVIAWVRDTFDEGTLNGVAEQYEREFDATPEMRIITPSPGARMELA